MHFFSGEAESDAVQDKHDLQTYTCGARSNVAKESLRISILHDNVALFLLTQNMGQRPRKLDFLIS